MKAVVARLLAVAGLLVLANAGLGIVVRAPDLAAVVAATLVWALAMGAVLLWLVIAPRLDAISNQLEQVVDRNATGRPASPGLRALQRLATTANALGVSVDAVRVVSRTDTLTQVDNRQALVSRLEAELDRARRYELPVAVAFIDIDRFKSVNDDFGHAAGDIVLRGVARVITKSIRSVDAFGRYGGEEFLLILPETTPGQAADMADRIRLLVARERFITPDGTTLGVTVSVGVAGGTSRAATSSSLIQDADTAMYSAKMLGRNQVFVFEVPQERGLVMRSPASAEMRALGRAMGREARQLAEEHLLESLRSMGGKVPEATVVAVASVELAKVLGLSETDVDALRIAARFHDAGMAMVPGEVLDRPHALSPSDWHLVTQHPQISNLMLEEAGRLRDASAIVLHHHERFAGHGYPHGLRGTEIPLGARILAIADAYRAMREDRPHRAALTHHQALREVARNAGTQFDPELAAAFCRLYEARGPADRADEVSRAV